MVYSKLDNVTFMIYDKSLSFVLSKFDLWNLSSEFEKSRFENNAGYMNCYIFEAAGVNIRIPVDQLKGSEDPFHEVCKEIRIEFTGTGMQFMLKVHSDIVKSFYDPNFLGVVGKDFRLKRVDFAFDFVNYQPEFLDQLIAWVFEHRFDLPNGRLLCGNPGGFSYSVRTGDQKTFYIGKPNSERLLRIYDKKLQYCPQGQWIKEIPEEFLVYEPGDIDSWIRVELQCRDKNSGSSKLLYDCEGKLDSVLRFIFDTYAVRDPQTKEVLPFLDKFFNWKELPRIIQNTKYGYYKPLSESASNWIRTVTLKNVILYIAQYGVEAYLQLIATELFSIQVDQSSSSISRYRRIRQALIVLADELQTDVSSLPGLEFGNYLKIKGVNISELTELNKEVSDNDRS